jgi:uncharacterized membrane protein (DUF485 family)
VIQELKVDDLTYQKIQRSPRFQQLVRSRSRFAWALSALMLAIYVAFILVIAFEPQWLGTQISSGSIITWGIPVGVGIIIAAFVLTGVYVWRANGEFDRLTAELLKELEA